jgi:hypothetical protein
MSNPTIIVILIFLTVMTLLVPLVLYKRKPLDETQPTERERNNKTLLIVSGILFGVFLSSTILYWKFLL